MVTGIPTASGYRRRGKARTDRRPAPQPNATTGRTAFPRTKAAHARITAVFGGGCSRRPGLNVRRKPPLRLLSERLCLRQLPLPPVHRIENLARKNTEGAAWRVRPSIFGFGPRLVNPISWRSLATVQSRGKWPFLNSLQAGKEQRPGPTGFFKWSAWGWIAMRSRAARIRLPGKPGPCMTCDRREYGLLRRTTSAPLEALHRPSRRNRRKA
jgi:hypothetical protein